MVLETLYWVAVASLAWFVVGVVVGRQVSVPGAQPKRVPAKAPEKRERRPDGRERGDRDRERERSSGGNGGNGGSSAMAGGTGQGVELYVGNLPYETSDKDLGRAFERFGKVLSVRMIENRRNGKPKGFGFVEMENDAAADTAIRAMNGTDFRGRSLVVNEAKSRER